MTTLSPVCSNNVERRDNNCANTNHTLIWTCFGLNDLKWSVNVSESDRRKLNGEFPSFKK